jgi:hypothetical protein
MRSATEGSFPSLTRAPSSGASWKVLGNRAGSRTTSGPSSLPIRARPGVSAAPDPAAPGAAGSPVPGCPGWPGAAPHGPHAVRSVAPPTTPMVAVVRRRNSRRALRSRFDTVNLPGR